MIGNYYIFLNDKQEGPYSTDQIAEMWHQGVISEDTYLLEEGASEWVQLRTITQKHSASTPAKQIDTDYRTPRIRPIGAIGTYIERASRFSPIVLFGGGFLLLMTLLAFGLALYDFIFDPNGEKSSRQDVVGTAELKTEAPRSTPAPTPKARRSTSRSYDSGDFVSLVGVKDVNVIIYDKQTKEPWGIITGAPAWDKLAVMRVDSVALGSGRMQGDISIYDRSYITSNFVTKRK